LRFFLPFKVKNFAFSVRYISMLPKPRIGYKGRVETDDFTLSGDSEKVGFGIHIPDGYHGFGFSVESQTSGMRCDLGATLYFWQKEQSLHKGVTRPILGSCNWPI
jgi:hypothetical protein